ncbi:MAG: DUF1330 domain-containing protein [Pseudolabrys sp.]|nr:DUF1330 domain-containing protein [Pseudolabrys sp.]MCA0342679.1 DUF1330 domain-containing protein [Pseudomonadota bacterium]MCW5683339.1 DUF1330 domain-containing protein [Pseudolabrys sp.]
MPVFIVSRVDIPEPQALARYMADAPATVEAYGGRYIVRSNQVEPLEGDTTCDRVVVLEFPDGDRARAWYHSPEYRPLRDLRQQNASASILLVQ